MSFKSAISKAFHFIVHAKAKVNEFLIHLFGPQTAAELAHAAVNVLENTKIGKEVEKYVREYQTSGLAGEVKRLQVFSKVVAFLAHLGIPDVPDSVINLLIELAVNKVKGLYEAAEAHDPQFPTSPLPVKAAPAPVQGAAPVPPAK